MFFFFLLRERPTKAQKVITFTYIKKLEGSQQGAACLYITSNTMTTQNLKKPSSLLPPPLPSLLSQSATDYRLIFFCSLHYFSPTIWCLFDLKLYFFFYFGHYSVDCFFVVGTKKSLSRSNIFSESFGQLCTVKNAIFHVENLTGNKWIHTWLLHQNSNQKLTCMLGLLYLCIKEHILNQAVSTTI